MLATGTVRCWGENPYGQLGNGTEVSSNTPVAVTGITNATTIAAGDRHTCSTLTSGEVKCWGHNTDGKLGNGSTTHSSIPVLVSGLTNATSVAAGGDHSCATLSTGAASCWGDNAYGQLGDTTSDSSSTPVSVSGIANAVSITAGNRHSCALLASGEARCWGDSFEGQLGAGTFLPSSTPLAVAGVSDAVSISAGYEHTCATLGTGGVRCWGYNDDGQVGDGTTTHRSQPVPVSNITNAVTVAAGRELSCAKLNSGQARCWGSNDEGRLGNGSPTISTTPVTVISGTCASAPDPGFSDVALDAYYYDSVAWLVQAGITGGTAPGKYSPNAKVTRAQMAVFLWTNAGQPTPTPPHSFSDVPTDSYYNDAVSWLVRTGVTSGTAPGKYSPNAKVTRAQMAVFLWQYNGRLGAVGYHGFSDVPPFSYYSAAVSWLVETGITGGTAPGKYSPNAKVTRAQMAVFLKNNTCRLTPVTGRPVPPST